MIIAVRRPGRTVEVIIGCLVDEGYWSALACGFEINYFTHAQVPFLGGLGTNNREERRPGPAAPFAVLGGVIFVRDLTGLAADCRRALVSF